LVQEVLAWRELSKNKKERMPVCIEFGLCYVLRRHETNQIKHNINTALKSI
jgi:hypothetical protein